MTETAIDVEIRRILQQSVEAVEANAIAGHVSALFARRLGEIASLLDHVDLADRVEAVLSKCQIVDFLGGALTNIDQSRVDVVGLRALPSRREAEKHYPVCDDALVLSEARKTAESAPHMDRCLAKDIASASKIAKSDLDFEEIALTMAIMGELDDAIQFIDAQPVAAECRRRVRFVTMLERCRHSHPSFRAEAQHFDLSNWGGLHVVLALAKRLPWPGYPYPDY